MAAVTIRPDRPRTEVTADTVRQARAHLAAHGLRKDGQYGGPGEACCVVGHVAAITRDLHIAEEAVEAFWPHRPNAAASPVWLHAVVWNDWTATEKSVDQFYACFIEHLEAGQ